MITQNEIDGFSQLLRDPDFVAIMSGFNFVNRNMNQIDNPRVQLEIEENKWHGVELNFNSEDSKQRNEVARRAGVLKLILEQKAEVAFKHFFNQNTTVWFKDPEMAILCKLKFG
jgi:hypothetical protein